jgi:putative transcriptional regulator
MATTKHKSPILQEVHAMAADLHEAGLIDQGRMREFDALCHFDNIEEMSPQKAHVSQAVLAAALNISLPTIQKWEMGDRKPSGSSLKLLHLIERRGLEAVL